MSGNPIASPVTWFRPTGPVLRPEVFASDTPPFYPFPSVRQVAKGYCPVAILHDLFWGRAYLGRQDEWIGGQIGSLYHDVVGSFRRDIAARRLTTHHIGETQVAEALGQRYFEDFAERRRPAPADADRLRTLFLRYVTRKAAEGELQQLAGQQVLTEVELANPKCYFLLGGQERRYPLHGRADELNVTRRILIERTLESDPLVPESPPKYKFWQAWLYGQIISTLDESRRPPALASLWNGPLDVLVETPDHDLRVEADESFAQVVAQAYYWIRAVFRGVTHTAIYSERACSEDNPDESCSHCRIDCLTPAPTFPARRDEIRRMCRSYARAFLNDRVWNYDLWLYRQSLLPPAVLEKDGRRFAGVITDLDEQHLNVEVSTEDAKAIQGRRGLLGVPSATGNFFVGHRIRLAPPEVQNAGRIDRVRLSFRISRHDSEQLRDAGGIALVTPPETEVFFAEQPLSLQDYDRSRLARLMKVGTRSAGTAQQSGVVRALRVMTRELQPLRQARLFD
jgi:hypothetical protein